MGLRSGPDMLYLLSLSRFLCSQLPNIGMIAAPTFCIVQIQQGNEGKDLNSSLGTREGQSSAL